MARPSALVTLCLAAAIAAPALAQQSPDTRVAIIPDELADRLPCDDGAARVLADWFLSRSDRAEAEAVIEALAGDTDACGPVREAAIGLFAAPDAGAQASVGVSAPVMTRAIPEAFIEAEQKAERLTFSVEPPPRNLTRNRIYRP